MTLTEMDGGQQAPARVGSRVIDWTALKPTATPTCQRHAVFDGPTATLDKLHGHITTLNPGENTGPLHRHPQEGMVEVNIDGEGYAPPPKCYGPNVIDDFMTV